MVPIYPFLTDHENTVAGKSGPAASPSAGGGRCRPSPSPGTGRLVPGPAPVEGSEVPAAVINRRVTGCFPSRMGKNEEKNPKPRPGRGCVSGAAALPVRGQSRAAAPPARDPDGPYVTRGRGGRSRSPPLRSGQPVTAGGPAAPLLGGRGAAPRHSPFSLRRQMWRLAGGTAAGRVRQTRRQRQALPPRPGRGHEPVHRRPVR